MAGLTTTGLPVLATRVETGVAARGSRMTMAGPAKAVPGTVGTAMAGAVEAAIMGMEGMDVATATAVIAAGAAIMGMKGMDVAAVTAVTAAGAEVATVVVAAETTDWSRVSGRHAGTAHADQGDDRPDPGSAAAWLDGEPFTEAKLLQAVRAALAVR
jgi:hypothetical protein